MDRKLREVLKEVKKIQAKLKRLEMELMNLEPQNDGMSYLVGQEIKQKLEEILERLP